MGGCMGFGGAERGGREDLGAGRQRHHLSYE